LAAISSVNSLALAEWANVVGVVALGGALLYDTI
jgi:hypothetical protein